MNTVKAPRRRTYSIAPERASELAHTSLKMSDELGLTVNRQGILDVLVELLVTDATVYQKVIKKMRKAR
jgi:hypothetical protein